MKSECKFDIVLIQDRNSHGFTAQVLQYDIAAQGKTIEEALKALMFTIGAEITYHEYEGKTSFELLDNAPDRYWGMHEQGIEIPVRPELVQPSLSDSNQSIGSGPQCESVALAA